MLSSDLSSVMSSFLSTKTGAAQEDDFADPPVVSHKDKQFAAGAETHEFQAEVSRLMDIIINSLYSNKDIFLRELISNGSDSLDKIRFLSLTDPSALGGGDAEKLEIRIKVDKERGVLSIRDRGVGMTKDDLKENLGTIAKSGTSAFLEQMQKGGDVNLIGQFGVGFYSVYLVADFVEVRSKHNDDPKQWIWESKADGAFAISEDTGEPLDRGCEINIYLKEEAQEYLEEDKLKELVGKYSEFINFPIYIYSSKEVEEEVPVEEDEMDTASDDDEDDADDEDDEDDDVDISDEDDEDDEPKTKTVTKTVWDWELLNDSKAIWLRAANDVDAEEYEKFYKALAKEDKAPLAYTHFKAEGDVEFKAILFIPEAAPSDMFDNYYAKASALKLYVRRVFISDEFDELLPKYLSFIKGIVDSDTLPLNVSRETLQQHTSLKTIKKKLVRKALDMIRKLAEEGEPDEDDEDAAAAADADADDDTEETKYETFWKSFGKAIKLGIIEDASNRTRLAKLLRFYTSKSPTKLVSLEQYVERMKEGQKTIYYLAGESREQLEKSPFLERLLAKDLEVIYFTDPIDEYTMQNLTEFDEFKFSNASKEDLKFGDADDAEKKRNKALREDFKAFTKWWKDALPPDDVEAVKLSNRLVTTPCSVVTSKYGWSANMERIMKAQALSDDTKMGYMRGRKTREINPRHPLVRALREKADEDPDAAETKELAVVMFETAMLESGFSFEQPADFAGRLFSLVTKTMGVDADAPVLSDEEIDASIPEKKAPEPEPEPDAADADVDAEEPEKDEL